MLKRYLLAPGPTPVPPEVLLAMARPMIHHRAPEFDKLFAEVREDLKWLFQTRNDVLILAASGTGGMEAAVVNLVPRGGKASVRPISALWYAAIRMRTTSMPSAMALMRACVSASRSTKALLMPPAFASATSSALAARI